MVAPRLQRGFGELTAPKKRSTLPGACSWMMVTCPWTFFSLILAPATPDPATALSARARAAMPRTRIVRVILPSGSVTGQASPTRSGGSTGAGSVRGGACIAVDDLVGTRLLGEAGEAGGLGLLDHGA